MAEKKKDVKKDERKETEVGEVTHYFANIGVAVIKATKGPIKKGDNLHIVGGSADFDQIVDSMQVDHKDVEEIAKGKEGGMKVSEKVHEGNKIFKIG
jgi:putative protease